MSDELQNNINLDPQEVSIDDPDNEVSAAQDIEENTEAIDEEVSIDAEE